MAPMKQRQKEELEREVRKIDNQLARERDLCQELTADIVALERRRGELVSDLDRLYDLEISIQGQ